MTQRTPLPEGVDVRQQGASISRVGVTCFEDPRSMIFPETGKV